MSASVPVLAAVRKALDAPLVPSTAPETVLCPCCRQDTRVPKHRHGERWLPGQDRLLRLWREIGIPHKVAARALGSTDAALHARIEVVRKNPPPEWR